MNTEKWFRVVSENGKMWVDGVAKKVKPVWASVVPDNTKGFVVVNDNDENVKFVTDKDMNKSR